VQRQSQSSGTPRNDLLGSYAAQIAAGAANSDEMLAPDGSVKPAWASFVAYLRQLSPNELAFRFARGDQYLRDAGVLFRQYDETVSSEREWPLSHIPVIMDEGEWQQISAGLIERAELLEFVLRDFYTDNTLVRSGQLPATLLSQNPAWLRPMIGMSRQNSNLLNTVSFEIGRGPSGKWWVISDLIEAPSTAGFAIENRIATSRVFSGFLNTANIHRLAGFFQNLQQTLFDIKGDAEGEIALLSPGLLNEYYPEHTYIARYLGLLLVEGEDLIVQDGQAMVRTVAGAKPISLLWNRLPSAMFDPLELNPTSMLGAAGLVQSLRDGALKTVNAVGAGVLETRGSHGVLPKIARARLGRGLALPNIATWWCGQEAQRAHVLENIERMMLGNAFSTTPLMSDPSTISVGTGKTELFELTQMLKHAGRNYVGQEAVTLSTTPAFENGQIVARPMCIRISLGRTENGWAVMPGGYARISAGADAKALAMQQGGRVADVWVTSCNTLPISNLLSQEKRAIARNSTHTVLPSRAADNLFWLGRYVERSEQNMRLSRAYFSRLSDGAGADIAMPTFMRTRMMGNVAAQNDVILKRFSEPLTYALQSASRISDRFSPDGMMALRSLVRQIETPKIPTPPHDDLTVEISKLLRQITGFAGLMHENMYRSDGWRFLSIGVSLERAANMCNVLAACICDDAPSGAFDLALEIGDSVVAHRGRFVVWANAASVVDLLGLDPQNPRSIRYHITRVKDHIACLPRQNTGTTTEVAALVLRVETRLAQARHGEITPAFLNQIQQDIAKISDALNAFYLV